MVGAAVRESAPRRLPRVRPGRRSAVFQPDDRRRRRRGRNGRPTARTMAAATTAAPRESARPTCTPIGNATSSERFRGRRTATRAAPRSGSTCIKTAPKARRPSRPSPPTTDDGEFVWCEQSNIPFGADGPRIQASVVGFLARLIAVPKRLRCPRMAITTLSTTLATSTTNTCPAPSATSAHGQTAASQSPASIRSFGRTTSSGARSTWIRATTRCPTDCRLSGSTDLGFGLDEGFLLTGPTDPTARGRPAHDNSAQSAPAAGRAGRRRFCQRGAPDPQRSTARTFLPMTAATT